jgi:hypothetical protein
MNLWHAEEERFQLRRKTTIEKQNTAIQKTEICNSVAILLANVVAKDLGIM